MNNDFPDEPVPAVFAEIIGNDYGTISLWKDYDRGRIGIELADTEELLTPQQAHRLADGYQDTLESNGTWGTGQSKEIVWRLHDYADEVQPYADDAEE